MLTELAKLETELAKRELELATLRAEAKVFEARYAAVIGSLYAELYEIEAQIAEAEALQNHADDGVQAKAAQARARADQAAREFARSGTLDAEIPPQIFKPSGLIKKLFRQLAKLIHPD